MSETPRITLTIALALGAVFAFRSDVFAAPPIAEDTPPDAPEEKAPKRWSPAEARKAVATFDEIFARTEYELPILEEFEKSKAVRDLSAVDHRIVARRLLALLRDRREKIRMETIAGLANMKSSAGLVIPPLMKMYEKDDNPPEVTVRLLETLGELQAGAMVDECVKLFSHEKDEIAVAAITALGKIGDRTVLPKLQELYELNHLDPSRGISIRVDTGGSTSQEAKMARAKGKRLEAMRRIAIRKEMIAVIEAALLELTGVDLESPEELKVWMERNRKLWR